MDIDPKKQETDRVIMEKSMFEAFDAIRMAANRVIQSDLTYEERLQLWEGIHGVAGRMHDLMLAYMDKYGLVPETDEETAEETATDE